MPRFNIIKYRNFWLSFSGALVVLAVVAVSLWGLRFGLDFTGGSLLEVKLTSAQPSVVEVQDKLKNLDLKSLVVQPTDNSTFIIRFQETSEEVHQKALSALKELAKEKAADSDKQTATAEEIKFESIGPSVGQELRSKSFWVFVTVLAIIILYIAAVFKKVSKPVASWKYGVTAVIALFHDVIITIGVFAILGKFFGAEVNTTFVAAILTVLGYSVNDTIVVFDRTRENIPKTRDPFDKVVNDSINQTMTRSINTTLTTLLALVAVLLFGGESIRDFVLALTVGIFCGAYSSIFVASPLLVAWNNWG